MDANIYFSKHAHNPYFASLIYKAQSTNKNSVTNFVAKKCFHLQ